MQNLKLKFGNMFMGKIILTFIFFILQFSFFNDNAPLFAATEDHGQEQKKVAAPAAKTDKLFNEFSIPTPYSQPFKIAVDKNGIVWFTEQGNDALGRFDPKTAKFSEHPIPSAKGVGARRWEFSETEKKAFTGGFSVSSVGSLAGIAIDSKGNIWFAEMLGNKIGRFSPEKEEFSEHDIPTPNSGPYGIAIDSKDNVWFTERNANKIGRFNSSASSFKEYSIPTSNSKPAGIAVDQKDNVWFTLSDTNKIGMLESQTGKISEYNILTPSANPYDIAVDSKGNVWFTELSASANKLGMYSPQMKRFDEAVVPTSSSVPIGLVIDKYDRVWFTENKGNKIGVFDPASAIFREYEIPTMQSRPIGIAISLSGDIWYVESDREASKIGYIAGLASVPSKASEGGMQSNPEKKFSAQFVIIIIISVIAITILLSYLLMSFRKANKKL
ncbi:MAG: hypothetical protein A2Z50_07475 [Nitrospirae bacterium RBG_19FT_COMBO_42_15]|nr:MAG: hypothetical protein A2Z50_07475 [Nitrospirae bacterium RBG_19FT_COMBO_42_15]